MSPSKPTRARAAAPSARRTPAAVRILETAERLFYAHGIGRVGVDTIVAESGVAKATLYVHFRTKDELVAAYLASRSRRQRERLEPLLSDDAPPGDRVLAAFARRAESLASPEWRGCAFINASAEYPEPGGIARHRRRPSRMDPRVLQRAGHPGPTPQPQRRRQPPGDDSGRSRPRRHLRRPRGRRLQRRRPRRRRAQRATLATNAHRPARRKARPPSSRPARRTQPVCAAPRQIRTRAADTPTAASTKQQTLDRSSCALGTSASGRQPGTTRAGGLGHEHGEASVD